MSSKSDPPEVWIKTEPDWDGETSGEEIRPLLTEYVHIKVEADFVKEEPDRIKDRPEWEQNGGRSAATGAPDTDHIVKKEAMAGPDHPTPGPSEACVTIKVEKEFVKKEPECITVEVEWDPPGVSSQAEHTVPLAPRTTENCGNMKSEIKETTGEQNALVSHQVSLVADKHSKTSNATKESTTFKCSYCSYASNNKSNLRLHERKHTGEKPYECSHCSYASASKSHLHLHERIHTGEKPYKCSFCSYSTTDKSNLLVHERKHTGEKPYKCSHCSYASTDKSTLQVHERIHTGERPYTCNHCSYASARRSLLLVHERKHTAEKPYKCNHCSFASANKKCLQVHEKNHTGEKPFKCSYCDYASNQKGNLVAHERRHANLTK